MNQKGFVSTIDALIALLVFFSIFMASSFYLSNAKSTANNSILLKESAMDALTVLEKSGTLEKAINSNNPNGIRSFENRIPNSICIEVQIFSETDLTTPKMSVLRGGCKKNFIDSATFNRAFIARNGTSANYFIARITAWQKVEQ